MLHDPIGRAAWAGPRANASYAPNAAFPNDARAIVEPVPRAVNQGGRAHRGTWRVCFRPRYAPRVDPLTGWLGGGDPLATIDLRFPDRTSAIGYCERQRLPFDLHV